MRRLIAPLLALVFTGCIIWRPSGGGLLNPCGTHYCDARPASHKKPPAKPLEDGTVIVGFDEKGLVMYELRGGKVVPVNQRRLAREIERSERAEKRAERKRGGR